MKSDFDSIVLVSSRLAVAMIWHVVESVRALIVPTNALAVWFKLHFD